MRDILIIYLEKSIAKIKKWLRAETLSQNSQSSRKHLGDTMPSVVIILTIRAGGQKVPTLHWGMSF